MVHTTVGDQPIDFMVDTGAEHSAVTRPVGPLSPIQAAIMGASKGQVCHPFPQPRRCTLGGQEVVHEFLYLPNCPVALMGRDLLGKLQARVNLDSRGQAALTSGRPEARVMLLMVPRGKEWRLCSLIGGSQQEPELPFKLPIVWAEDSPPGLARHVPPVVVELKSGAEPALQKQCFTPHKAQVGIQKHLERRLKYEILRPRQSSWNTPLLPVQKPGTNECRPVQGLRAANQATVTLHPLVPNPYTSWASSPLRQLISPV